MDCRASIENRISKFGTYCLMTVANSIGVKSIAWMLYVLCCKHCSGASINSTIDRRQSSMYIIVLHELSILHILFWKSGVGMFRGDSGPNAPIVLGTKTDSLCFCATSKILCSPPIFT
ncbi:hypothetical protein DERP_002964 [Dermatophagoides pteronyssinus]|uniref:Uncharacterized protein n=1 Tax=Dermatophagoides pteronyssinus TaxID=6956 RepID=A0ABQ8JW66_DERPT|nr:hypothetical protein DERP_002964 [Dermatophagoides pteronyssinus]